MIKKLLFIILFLTLNFVVKAQNEANVWYFGTNAGLDFNSGSPVALTDGQISTLEGCTSISDTSGNLLFYTDGVRVWNKNHAVMFNGFGLFGHYSAAQSALIVPKPGSTTIYYIFTVDAQARPNGFQYSIVDMSLAGGLGIVTSKNNPLITPTCEKVTSVQHANGTDIWVITHSFYSDDYYAYLVSSTGISAPVISSAGVYVGDDTLYSLGYMKVSPLGDKIGVVHRKLAVELLDYNNATGVVSNAINILPCCYTSPFYGIEFAPCGNVLYVGEWAGPGEVGSLYQFDLFASNIPASKILLSANIDGQGALQLGPDGRIYVARYNQNYLGTINQPGIVGLGCGYQPNSVNLGTGISQLGLPPFIQSFFKNANLSIANFCLGDLTEFVVLPCDNQYNYDSAFWDFGDPITGINNFSSDTTAYHVYSDTGTYTVSLALFFEGESDTTYATVYITSPDFSLGNDTAICLGSNLVLSPSIAGASYVWSNGSSAPTLTVSSAGTYWVDVTLGNCTKRDSIITTSIPYASGTFLDTICSNSIYTLPSGSIVFGPGVYSDTIPGFHCDSIIAVTLVAPQSSIVYGLYAANADDYLKVNPLTGAISATYNAFANTLGWVNGAFTIHEQATKLYWISSLLRLYSLNLFTGVITNIATSISTLPYFWGLRYYNGFLYTITTSLDNDKKLVRINPTTGLLDAGFPGIEINGTASLDILISSSPVINPITGKFYIPLYGNKMLSFDIAGGTGSIITLSGYGTATGYIGLLEINEHTGEMYALSGFSDIVKVTLTGPTTATISLIKSLTTGSGFSNPISTFDSDNELYIFQAETGCSAQNPIITIDINTGQEWCSDPVGFAYTQLEYLNCTPSSLLRAPENFNVFLYPNPVSETLQMEIELLANEDIYIQVFDVSGAIHIVKRMNGLIGENKLSMNLSDLSSGVYIVNVRSGRNQFNGKVIKL